MVLAQAVMLTTSRMPQIAVPGKTIAILVGFETDARQTDATNMTALNTTSHSVT